MKIILSKQVITEVDLLQDVERAWQEHPLRNPTVDQKLAQIMVVVTKGEEYGLNADNHPEYLLKCAPDSPYILIPQHEVILHEFTHLIDRFNPQFVGERSPEEVKEFIDNLPSGNANESVKRAFNVYWNAYIDGRLQRKGIAVHSLDERIEEKLGLRMQEGEIQLGEKESVVEVWHDEQLTLDGLVQLAKKYPNRRPKKYWINQPENSA